MAEGGGFFKSLFGGSKKKSQRVKKSRAGVKSQEYKSRASGEFTKETPSAEGDEDDSEDGTWEDIVESYEDKQEIEYVKRHVQRKKTQQVKAGVESKTQKEGGKRSIKFALAKPKSPVKSPFASAFYSRTTAIIEDHDTLPSEPRSNLPIFLKENSFEEVLDQRNKTNMNFNMEEKYDMAVLLGVQGLFPRDVQKTDIAELSVETLCDMAVRSKLNLENDGVLHLNGKETSTEQIKLSQTLNQKVALWKGNITQLEVDGIVNSASSILLSNRSGVSAAIRKHAGPLLDYELRKIWYTYVGDVVHTAGYFLPAKYILHTSGPPGYWRDAEKALKNCYLNCLERAKQLRLRTLAFCCIGTGAKEVSTDISARIALETTREWLLNNKKHVDKVVFCIYEHFQMFSYKKIMQHVFPVIPGDFSKRASLPPEILRMDSRSKDLYLKALEEGEAKVHNIRVMVVGHFDVGKTTLTKRLLGENVDINSRASTDGIEVHVKRCRVNLKTGKWEVQRGLHKDDSSTRLANVVQQVTLTSGEEVTTNSAFDHMIDELKSNSSMLSEESTPDNSLLIAAPSGLDETDATPYVSYQSSELKPGSDSFTSNESVLSENDSPLMEELKLLVQDVSCTELEDINNYADLSIWDFAGQYAFYGTHQIFLTPRAVYLLVIDLSKHIDSFVEKDTCFIDSDGKQRSMKISEFVEFWLKSIHFYTKEEATVILVGTHADKLKEENRLELAQTMFKEIRDNIINTEYSYCLTEFEVILDNSIIDEELVKLKHYVFKLASSKDEYWGKSVPAKWLTLERTIERMRESGTKIIEKSCIQELNQRLCVPLDDEELEISLQFQHECGLILYFSEEGLKNYIILDPQWLIDGFKCFITTEMFVFNKPKIRPLWVKFNKQGILTEEFIDLSWHIRKDKEFYKHKDHLLKLMEKLDIIARPVDYTDNVLEGGDQATVDNKALKYYFTPCMLKEKPYDYLIDTSKYKPSTSTHKLCYTFESGFVPPAIFNRLLAACMSKWQPRKHGRKPPKTLLFCGCGVFDLDSSRIHQLTLTLIDDFIHIWVTKYGGSGEFPDRTKCDEVRNFVESTLIRLCSINSSSESVQTFIKCPESDQLDSIGMIEIQDLESNREYCCTMHDEGSKHMNHQLKSTELLRGWTGGWRTESTGNNNDFLGRSPTDIEISTMSQRIINWEQIGYQLGLEESDISHIKSDNSYTVDRIAAMLRKWRRFKSPATFRALKGAINTVEGDSQTIFEGFS